MSEGKEKFNDSSAIDSDMSITVRICCSCSHNRQTCKQFWCSFNSYWRLTALSLVVICYLLLGAVLFNVAEKSNEVIQVQQVQEGRASATNNLTDILLRINNLTEEEARNLTPIIIQLGRVASTTLDAEQSPKWDFWSAFFFASTVITTVGE